MDTRRYALRRMDEVTASLAWRAMAPEAAARWRRRARGALRRVVGLPPGPTRAPLVEGDDGRLFRGYQRRAVRFESRPGCEVVGYYLLPDGVEGRLPGVLCLPGHGRGVDSIVGIAVDGTQRDIGCPDEYQADFALQCVAQGYPTLAIEQISFGHRRDEQARSEGPEASSCVRDSVAALMLGETVAGWRVWDAMRALDVLGAMREVDPRRLVTMGISGGGLTSLWTASLDPRVRACVVSGYLSTFRGSILAVDHCVDNYVPGILRCLEMPDIAALVAPRLLFAESGADDAIFPLASFHAACDRVRAAYAACGCPERFAFEAFDGDHRFHGAGAFRFLRDRLMV
ncbi:MAG TPA: alpha/beta hydrolase family protein [Chthonomonadales bacterium]|nr:alpha/beta hydrolase family protein [Chthonomonadales bacterium]